MKFTSETARRTIRTFLQVFLSTLSSGLAVLTVDTDSRALKITLFVLIASAIGTALGAVMNLEQKGGCENGENDTD